MSSSSETHTFTIDQQSLHAFFVSLQGGLIPSFVRDEAHEAFKQLAPYLKDSSQALYIRDIPFLAIDGKYAGGHCYNRSEAMISVPDWATDRSQLVAAINHELHHMARWQNPGYGNTLGGALVSEGIASYYEGLRSGWQSPWSEALITKNHAELALKEWDSETYDHGEWFFDGKLGKWVGYALGTRLAKELYKDGFDLSNSIHITPAEAKSSLEAVIQHL